MAGASVESFYGAAARSMSQSWHDFIFGAFDPAGTTRCAHVALAGLVTAVISLSWMTAVSLVPSQDRPYVDGSPHDSVYTQVFDYNGLGRLTGNWASLAGPPSPLVVAAKENGQLLTAETMGIKPSWHRLLAGPFAADGGWLLPAAGRCCRSAASSATCRPRRWPSCRPTSAVATCGHSCCRCHRRARTRGCGGSSRTAPGSSRPRTAARSRTPTSSAGARHQPVGRLPERPKHLPHDAAVPAVSGLAGRADPYHRLEQRPSAVTVIPRYGTECIASIKTPVRRASSNP